MNALILLTACGTAAGLWLVIVAARRRPPRLEAALAALSARPEPAVPAAVDGEVSFTSRLGRPAVRLLHRVGLPTQATRRDLAALGRDVDTHLAEKAAGAIIGLVMPTVLCAVLSLAGHTLGFTLPAGFSILLAAMFFLAPDMQVRAEAEKMRTSFRHSLGAYLDLVVISLAGGAGVDQALHDAAAIGGGTAFVEIRYALTEARLANVPPWQTLAALGERLGVPELEELAAGMGLAGTEGARVRTSLQARAEAMRTRQITDTESKAASATSRMSMASLPFLAGFVILLGYPTIMQVLNGL